MHLNFTRQSAARAESEAGSSDPYSAIATIYDRIMDHVDYRSWARHVDRLLRRHTRSAHSVLEIGCGTGSLACELHQMGYELTCSDLSLPMLRRARTKFITRGIAFPLFVASMDAIPCATGFDAVICLYDAINYMTDQDGFEGALGEMHRLLKPGGVLVFDVCTVRNSTLFFADNVIKETIGETTYERRCSYDPEQRLQKNAFTVRSPRGVMTETHTQKIYTLVEIEDMLERASFAVAGRYDDMSLLPGGENSERVHYVCAKRETDEECGRP